MGTTKLQPKVKEKWVEALRSGNYKQTNSYLCSGSRYCCLGVLATISGKNKDLLRANSLEPMDRAVVLLEYCSAYENAIEPGRFDPVIDPEDLTAEDREKYKSGMDIRDGNIHLWRLNDACPSVPFTEIADLIERYM